jgi:outer membrane protein
MQLNYAIRLILCSSLSAVFTPLTAYAQDPQFPGVLAPTPMSSHWGLGLGGSIKGEQYRGAGTKTSAIPLLMYDSEYVHVFGTTVDLKLPSVGGVNFALRAKYGTSGGYKPDDSAFLHGMEQRKGGPWLGGVATWKTAPLTLTAEWLKAPSNSNGQQFKIDAEHAFKYGKLQLVPHIDIEWSDKKYVDYYYGVTANEATVSRPAFMGKASTDTSLGMRAAYPLQLNQLILLDVSIKHFGSSIGDSPLVDKTTQPSLRFGYLYQF